MKYDILIVSTQSEATFTTFTVKTIIKEEDAQDKIFLVDRRYSEFEDLYHSVVVLNVALKSILPQFPKKNPFKNSEWVVDERRARFDNMLGILSQYESIMNSTVMQNFLAIQGDVVQPEEEIQANNKTDLEMNMEQFLLMGGSSDKVFEGDMNAELERLKKLGINVAERISLLKELLSSEVSYVQFMAILYLNYYKPIMENENVLSETGITTTQGRDVFPPNINEIYSLHCAVLSKLHMRYADFMRNEEPDECMYFLQIGDIFTSIAPLLNVYVPYLREYEDCNKNVRTLRNTIQPFDMWLSKTKKANSGYDIAALLIMVVQRIPRYIIFLQNLLKIGDPDHIDTEQLQNALTSLSIVMKNHNEQIRKGQMFNKMIRLGDELLLDFDANNRQLITESIVWTTTGTFIKELVKYTAYLFNDMVLLVNDANTSKTYKMYGLCGAYVVGGDASNLELMVKEDNKVVKLQFLTEGDKKMLDDRNGGRARGDHGNNELEG